MTLKEILEDCVKNKEPRPPEKSIGKFYPSSVGKCNRAIVYQMLGYPQEKPDLRFHSILDNGNYFHDRLERLFFDSGWLIASELAFKDPELKISGRLDLIIKNPYPKKGVTPITLKNYKKVEKHEEDEVVEDKSKVEAETNPEIEQNETIEEAVKTEPEVTSETKPEVTSKTKSESKAETEPEAEEELEEIIVYEGFAEDLAIVELKSISDKGFNRLRAPKDEHMRQVMLYMERFGIHDGYVLYENKNTQELLEFFVPYNRVIAEDIIKKIKFCGDHYERQELPPKQFQKNDFECIYCDYKEICWPSKHQYNLEDIL